MLKLLRVLQAALTSYRLTKQNSSWMGVTYLNMSRNSGFIVAVFEVGGITEKQLFSVKSGRLKPNIELTWILKDEQGNIIKEYDRWVQ